MSEEENLPNIGIITLVVDEDGSTQLDIGDIHPALAASLLAQAVEALNFFIPYPSVRYKGQQVAYVGDDDDCGDGSAA